MNRLEERVADQLSVHEALAKAYVDTNQSYFSHPEWREMADFEKEYLIDAMQRALSALEAQGRKIVPVEPTEAMVSAGISVYNGAGQAEPAEVYAAMLNAVEG